MIGCLGGYLCFFLLFAALVALAGAALLPPRARLPQARWTAIYTAGASAWMVALFLLAAVGALRLASVLGLATAFLAILAIRARRRGESLIPRLASGRGDAPGTAGAPAALRAGWPWLLAAALLAVILAPCFVTATSPRLAWDADVYHLTLPRIYLEHHGFRAVPLSVYSNWPLGTELLFAMGMMLKDYRLATLAHLGFGLLVLLAMTAALRASGRGRAAPLAALLFVANPVVLWELSIAYVDIASAFFLTASFLFASLALDDASRRREWLLLAGVAAGSLASTKLNGVVGGAAVAVMLIAGLVRRREVRSEGRETPSEGRHARGPRRAWLALRPFAAWFAVPWLALPALWLAKSARYTGNPVYPFLHPIFGGPGWSNELTRQFTSWQAGMGMGRSPLDYLLLPFRVPLMGGAGYPHFDGRIAWWWILLVPLALIAGRREPVVRRALAVAALYSVTWSAGSQQMRLLIPALPLLAIAAAAALDRSLDSLRTARPRLAGAILALLIAAAGAGGLLWNRGMDADAGTVLAELRAHGSPDPEAYALPIHQFVNQRTPPDARVLCLNINRGFFLRRDYLADSFFEASQIADAFRSATDEADVRRRLAAWGVTHILLEREDKGIAFPEPLKALVADPRYSRRVSTTQDGLFTLFELAPPGP